MEAQVKIAKIEESKLARTGQQYLDLIASDADWIVRSPDDLRQLRRSDEDPLAKLTDYDFETFESSLLFGGGGVAHGNYKPLMSALTLTDIFQVFARFGMSRDYVAEVQEAKCVGGVCEFSFWNFCAANCSQVKKA
jgi:hypothetical protein